MKKIYCPTKVIGMGLLLFFTALNGCKTELSPEPVEAKQTASANVIGSSSDFKHPGIVNTQASLDYVKEEICSGCPKKAAFDNLVTWLVGSTHQPSTYVYNPDYTLATGNFSVEVGSGNVGTEQEEKMKFDCQIAYARAVHWALTGNQGSLTKAKDILNAYATRFTELKPLASVATTSAGKAQVALEAAWMAPTFAAAAEIMRHYKINKGQPNETGAGWTKAVEFESFLNKLKYHIDLHIIDPVGDMGRKDSNWGTSGGYARMAIAVYQSNVAEFQEARTFLLARMQSKVSNSTSYPGVINANGFIPERYPVSEDCWHYQYILSGLSLGGEIERIQNGTTTIYDYKTSTDTQARILSAYQYQWKSYYGVDGFNSTTTRMCEGYTKIFPGAEVANRYYKPNNINLASLRGVNAPNEVPFDFSFLGWTTLTHYNVPK